MRSRDSLSKIYVVLSCIGIAVAAYDAYDYLTQNFAGCNINQTVSCLGVFQSGHTSLFGIPFWLMGLIWFPLTLILGFVAVRKYETSITLNPIILLPFLMVGNIFTMYLWYLELGVIGIICPVCVSLYVIKYALTAVVAGSLVL